MKKIKLLTPIVTAVALSGVATTITGCACSSTGSVELYSRVKAKGISVKSHNVQKNKETTIEFNLPENKKIESIVVSVGDYFVTVEDGLKIEDNKITIPAEKMIGSVVTISDISLEYITIPVELSKDSSAGVSIKETNIVKGKDSTITLNIPDGKVIDTTVLTIGNKVLTIDTDYTIENNIVKIKGSAVDGSNVNIKVIVKDVVSSFDLTYSSTDKKYVSSDITIRANATLTFNIKLDVASSKVVLPQTFSIVKDGSTDLVPLSSTFTVTINGEAYTGATLKDNEIDLGDLSEKELAKDDIVKLVVTTTNSSEIKAKALCEPYVEAPYLDMVGNKEFKLSVSGKYWDGKVEYSTDGSHWTEWDGTTQIPSVPTATGQYHIYLRGQNTKFIDDSWNPSTFSFSGEEGLEVSLKGNIMTLLDYEDPDSATMTEGCFYQLFYGCTSLVSVPKLPATNLADSCYNAMFYGCSGIKSLPKNLLPATTLADYCYNSMFGECTGLTSLPDNLLPATTLVDNCYEYMFWGCTSLTTIGKIGKGNSLTISGNRACLQMFAGCSELKVVETDTPEDAFMSIDSITEDTGVVEMFGNCKAGSIETPEAGKSYKYVLE